jgi:hypothetical protein
MFHWYLEADLQLQVVDSMCTGSTSPLQKDQPDFRPARFIRYYRLDMLLFSSPS